MVSKRLYVINGSTLVSDTEMHRMVAACNLQVRDHVAPAWGANRVVVASHTGKDLASVQAEVPVGSWVIVLLDDPDDPGALGWHSEDDQDRVYGEIFAKPCLEDGQSSALTGPYAVSSVLSHEVIETFGDPLCNLWSDTGEGFLVATELCDPVEADTYVINGITMSNFALPAWFDAEAPAGTRLDFLNKCTKPFSMTPGGYWVQAQMGKQTQKFDRVASGLRQWGFDVHNSHGGVSVVFSPEMPDWKRKLKLGYGRNVLKREIGVG